MSRSTPTKSSILMYLKLHPDSTYKEVAVVLAQIT